MHLSFSLVSLIAQDDSGSSGGGTIQLVILLMIPLAMYFLLFRPQRKRVKEAAEMQKALGIGDEVVLTSGIYGFITGEEGSLFWVEIDDDVQVRVAKAAIQGKVNTAAPTPPARSATRAAIRRLTRTPRRTTTRKVTRRAIRRETLDPMVDARWVHVPRGRVAGAQRWSR